jgi:hypothetical protein
VTNRCGWETIAFSLHMDCLTKNFSSFGIWGSAMVIFASQMGWARCRLPRRPARGLGGGRRVAALPAGRRAGAADCAATGADTGSRGSAAAGAAAFSVQSHMAARSSMLFAFTYAGTIRPILASGKFAPRSTTLALYSSQYEPCVTGSERRALSRSTYRSRACCGLALCGFMSPYRVQCGVARRVCSLPRCSTATRRSSGRACVSY